MKNPNLYVDTQTRIYPGVWQGLWGQRFVTAIAAINDATQDLALKALACRFFTEAPADVLPALFSQFGLIFPSLCTEQQQRALLAIGWDLNRYMGTRHGVRLALEAIGLSGLVITFFTALAGDIPRHVETLQINMNTNYPGAQIIGSGTVGVGIIDAPSILGQIKQVVNLLEPSHACIAQIYVVYNDYTATIPNQRGRGGVI